MIITEVPLAFSGQSVALFTSGWSQDDRASSKIDVRIVKVGGFTNTNISTLCITMSSIPIPQERIAKNASGVAMRMNKP